MILLLIKIFTFFKGNWKGLVAAALIVAPIVTVVVFKNKAEVLNVQLKQSRESAAHAQADLERTNQEKVLLLDNQKAWVAVRKQIDDLSHQTAVARSQESAQVANIKSGVAVAKEGIKRAPQADQPFTFSDAAFALVRPDAPGDAVGGGSISAPKAAPGMGHR